MKNAIPNIRRRSLIIACALTTPLLCQAWSAAAAEQTFPSRAITLIVPSAAGGPSDLIARLVALPLGKNLGQTVVVENRSGAGGAIGMNAVANAAPDGYTLGLGTASTLTTNPLMNKAAKVDPLKDITSISPLVSIPGVLVVNNALGTDNLQKFTEMAKSKPSFYTQGSSGVGSIGHLANEALNKDLNVEVRHIPYRGMGPAMNALLSDEVQILYDQYPSSRQHILAGSIKPLAVAWDTRLAELPSVPTLKEAGYPDLQELMLTWFGLVAPAGLSDTVRDQLNVAVRDALSDPAVVEQLRNLGAEPIPDTPAVMQQRISEGLERNRKIIEQRGLTFDK